MEVTIPTDKRLNRRNKTNLFGSLKRIQVRTLSQRLETNIGSSGLPGQSWEWEAAEGARARGEALRKQGPVKNLRGIGGDREEGDNASLTSRSSTTPPQEKPPLLPSGEEKPF